MGACVSRSRSRDLSGFLASPCFLALASAAAANPDFAGATTASRPPQTTPNPKKFKQESNLERIGNHARELANDIESALFGEDDS